MGNCLKLPEIFDIIEAIPERMCGGLQPEYLYNLSKNTKGKGAVVEIGTCAGKSTIALAHAQKEKNGRKIVTIDIVEHADLKNNLSKANVEDYVTRLINKSKLVASNWSEPVELLWIDGGHSYPAVETDIKSWAALVIPGGIMAFHDYPSQGGAELGSVGRAIYKYVLSRPDKWRVVSDREAGSIVAFERLVESVNKLKGFNHANYVIRKYTRRLKERIRWTIS